MSDDKYAMEDWDLEVKVSDLKYDFDTIDKQTMKDRVNACIDAMNPESDFALQIHTRQNDVIKVDQFQTSNDKVWHSQTSATTSAKNARHLYELLSANSSFSIIDNEHDHEVYIETGCADEAITLVDIDATKK